MKEEACETAGCFLLGLPESNRPDTQAPRMLVRGRKITKANKWRRR